MAFNKQMALAKIFALAGRIVPAADRQANRILAREFLQYTPSSFTLDFSRQCLKKAGYDTEADGGYQEVLKLSGGKKEFDELYPAP